MKIGIQTYGTTGDCRSLIAIGAGLRAAGHQVTICITSVDQAHYSAVCDRLGLEYRPVAAPDPAVFRFPEFSRTMRTTRNPFRQIRLLLEATFFPRLKEIYAASRDLCRECDAVVGHFLVYPLKVAAELAAKPFFGVVLTPGMLPTAYYPPPGAIDLPNFGPFLNRALWNGIEWAIDRELLQYIRQLWVEESLPTPRHALSEAWQSNWCNLIAVSPLFTRLAPDQVERFQVCGFARIPEWAEPAELPGGVAEFLDAGTAPVFMTLGSIQLRTPQEEAEWLAEAARTAGCRAIVQTSQPCIRKGSPDEDIFYVGRVPHQLVFPRCAAVVHHGGAQTSMAATRAGCPSVLTPYIDEQVVWAKAMHRVGVAPRPLTGRRVTPERIAASIAECLESARIRNCVDHARRTLCEEDGPAIAAAVIEARLTGLPVRTPSSAQAAADGSFG